MLTHQPQTRNEFKERAFTNAEAIIWNSLLADLRQTDVSPYTSTLQSAMRHFLQPKLSQLAMCSLSKDVVEILAYFEKAGN